METLHKAALIRAYRTFLQTLGSTIPAGITVNFVAGIDVEVILLTILGMVCTAAIAGCSAFIMGVAAGLPEVMDDEYDELELYFRENENGLGETMEVSDDDIDSL